LRAENKNDAELFAEIKDELLGDSIYVFTPQGDVRELPAGSTAIDFAYSIHSRIGETIVGAKADGNIIPLSAPLKNTQIIEILTNPQSHPTENQLHNVKTAKARNKIRSWLLQNGAMLGGQSTSTSGTGATGANGFVNSSVNHLGKESISDKSVDRLTENTEEAPIRIRIGDTTNFMVKSAKCCNPIYGDEIIGYISRGRGLIIHRVGCENFLRIPNVKERSVPVVWEENPVTIRRKKG
jgi:GTP pyrophosphokinase